MLKICIFALFSIILNGCNDRVIYKEVKIPIKCDVLPIKKPSFTGDYINDLKNILIYSEQLEKDLNFCLGKF